jgi:hypothetical protein
VRLLLEAGVDVNIRMKYRDYSSELHKWPVVNRVNALVRYELYDSVLDREGVSDLERTRRLVDEYSDCGDWVDREFRVQEGGM